MTRRKGEGMSMNWSRDGRDWISGPYRIARIEPRRSGDPNCGRFLLSVDGKPGRKFGDVRAAKRLADRDAAAAAGWEAVVREAREETA